MLIAPYFFNKKGSVKLTLLLKGKSAKSYDGTLNESLRIL